VEFISDIQKEGYARVKELLTELYGEMYEVAEEAPRFTLAAGSSMVSLLVWPWGDERAIVEVRAYVIMGAELTPELMKYLLQENNALVLGAFGLDDEGDIFFAHTLLANDLDKSELRATVNAVKVTADSYDDEIQKRWGGQRVADR
jgi:hypothetical protein